MKITDVQTIPLEAAIPPEKRVRSGAGLKISRQSVVVRVMTDEGVYGLGSCCAWPLTVVQAVVEDALAPLIVGEDPFAIDRLWDRMYYGGVVRGLGPRSIGVMALGAIDIALWDLKGKALGLPVYRLLGGPCHDKVRVYASSIYWQSPEGAASEALSYVRQGYTAVKLKTGADVAADLACVAAIRKAVGPKIDIMIDANMCYSPKLALQFGRELEQYDVFWYEEPCFVEDIEALADLTKRLNVRVATGENMYTRWGFAEVLCRRAADVVQADPGRSGGISEVRKIAAMASACGVMFSPHSFGDAIQDLANLHTVASLPETFILELDQTYNPLRTELLVGPPRVQNGFMDLPSAPGLGAELVPDVEARFPYKRTRFLSMGARPAVGLKDEVPEDRTSKL